MHCWQNGTRCRDGVNVLWCRSHLVWLVFEGSIPTCACFHLETFFVTCSFHLLREAGKGKEDAWSLGYESIELCCSQITRTTDSVLLAAIQGPNSTRVLIAALEEYEDSSIKKTPAKMLPSTHYMCTICIFVVSARNVKVENKI